jgi:hypothetical protein
MLPPREKIWWVCRAAWARGRRIPAWSRSSTTAAPVRWSRSHIWTGRRQPRWLGVDVWHVQFRMTLVRHRALECWPNDRACYTYEGADASEPQEPKREGGSFRIAECDRVVKDVCMKIRIACPEAQGIFTSEPLKSR